MSDRRPPKLATWLVNTFSPGRHRGALAGDLFEEFRNGRSQGWFWRQTLLIIARRLGREACSAKSLFAGAILALPDCAFWILNRPPRHSGAWVFAACVLLILLVVVLPRVLRRPFADGWESACWFVAVLATLCILAWADTDSLAGRLWRDAGWWAMIVVSSTIAKGRARLRQPQKPGPPLERPPPRRCFCCFCRSSRSWRIFSYSVCCSGMSIRFMRVIWF